MVGFGTYFAGKINRIGWLGGWLKLWEKKRS